MANTKIHVAGAEVGRQIQKEDLEDKFRPFGTISSVWVARQPPGFAFIEFEDPRDAEDAIRDMHDKEILGCVIKVEESRNGRGRGGGGGGGGEGNSEVKPGDWPCDACGANNFARRFECFQCGAPKPGGGGGGGGGGYGRDGGGGGYGRDDRHDRSDRYDDRRDGGRGYRDDHRGGGGGGYRGGGGGGGGYRDDDRRERHRSPRRDDYDDRRDRYDDHRRSPRRDERPRDGDDKRAPDGDSSGRKED